MRLTVISSKRQLKIRMLLTRKSLAITILVLLFMTKIVIACSTAIDPNNPGFDPIAETFSYGNFYFFSSIFVALFIVVFYFLTRQRKLWLLISAIISLLLMFPLTFLSLMPSCGNSFLTFTRLAFIYFLFLFALQVILRIIQKKNLKLELP